jgi:hypothetical protein
MPTLNLSQEFHVFDNPESLTLKNVDNVNVVTTAYGFRRAMTLAYTDQSGVAKIENITRFLVWKANLDGFKPMVDCEITDASLVKYYVNSIDNSGNREYYGLDCTQQS